MDVYRCRFVKYPTSAITCLAFSQSTNKGFVSSPNKIHTVRLALGRANGDIEIWNPLGGDWVQEAIFKGGKGRTVEGLAWVEDLAEKDEQGRRIDGPMRLFSIGNSNAVTEWNLSTGLPLRSWIANNSEIWCLAAQPPYNQAYKVTRNDENSNWPQKLVAGFADGSISVLSTNDNDLQFVRVLSRPTKKQARVLSLAFVTRNKLAAGYADSSFRIYDISAGTFIRSVSLGAGPVGGPKNILVWAIKTLPKGEIVTGDSTGGVRIFDRTHYSQLQKIASHDADILTLAVSQDTGAIFSAGMDRRTAKYVKGSGTTAKWIKTDHTTYHQHDVKAMSSFESKSLNVIASGGLDTNLVIAPMREHGKQYQYTMSGLPHQVPFDSASGQRLVVSWWEREINIWQIEKKRKGPNTVKRHHHVAKIVIKGEENITCAVLSQGKSLVVATSAEVKIFKLEEVTQNGKTIFNIITLPPISKSGAKLAKYSHDQRWLALVQHDNSIKILDMLAENSSRKHINLHRTKRPEHADQLSGYQKTITQMTFSYTSKMLVVSDLRGHIDSWVFQEETETPDQPVQEPTKSEEQNDSDSDSDSEESSKFGWIPNPSRCPPLQGDFPIALTFRWASAKTDVQDDSKYNLFVITARHKIQEFNMKTGGLTLWSKRNPHGVMPETFKITKERTKGVFWGPNGWMWLYGASWLFGLNTSVDHDITIKDDSDGKSGNELVPTTKSLKRKFFENTGAGSTKYDDDIHGLVLQQVEEKPKSENGEEEPEDEDVDMLDGFQQNHQEITQAKPTNKNETRNAPKWYMSRQYRDIAGIVPLTLPRSGSSEKDVHFPEVVIIERPIWDLDLPDRFETTYK
ncbi:WD40 repeat-like protein [Microthyrium microscopicum]|uniref:WD40 repeat-like protein n=1 Tax=Microthyrium microscopicum TaxID=703497 RepID=A0A6A6U593_9PEZI|nr:WD40 repeat-like protein [Microthyrium microscopicum]